MFTGIIEEVGQIARIDPLGGGRRLTIRANFAGALRPDQSVAVNGVCLTVVAADAQTFTVEVVEETLRKTTLGRLTDGMPVNLERALPASGRLDGHFVQGHVDTTGEVVSVEVEETDRLYRIRFSRAFRPYLIPTGSIAIDGISLTVARLEEETLTVAIIPHTFRKTNVSTWLPGTPVNLEFDMIGKYVIGWLTHGRDPKAAALRSSSPLESA
ncbi:riboflavin synthase [Rhodothermus marinus]|uniref:riboflavin synthase n=1 Tax=Rhodothermus marinus TaxID=29549 RepID=UPI0006CF68A1|nr:riboflavin synthase [Rhodothermus marinus]